MNNLQDICKAIDLIEEKKTLVCVQQFKWPVTIDNIFFIFMLFITRFFDFFLKFTPNNGVSCNHMNQQYLEKVLQVLLRCCGVVVFICIFFSFALNLKQVLSTYILIKVKKII